MENLQNGKKQELSQVMETIARPLSGSHEAWRLYEAAKRFQQEIENCQIKIKELEKIINES